MKMGSIADILAFTRNCRILARVISAIGVSRDISPVVTTYHEAIMRACAKYAAHDNKQLFSSFFREQCTRCNTTRTYSVALMHRSTHAYIIRKTQDPPLFTYASDLFDNLPKAVSKAGNVKIWKHIRARYLDRDDVIRWFHYAGKYAFAYCCDDLVGHIIKMRDLEYARAQARATLMLKGALLGQRFDLFAALDEKFSRASVHVNMDMLYCGMADCMPPHILEYLKSYAYCRSDSHCDIYKRLFPTNPNYIRALIRKNKFARVVELFDHAPWTQYTYACAIEECVACNNVCIARAIFAEYPQYRTFDWTIMTHDVLPRCVHYRNALLLQRAVESPIIRCTTSMLIHNLGRVCLQVVSAREYPFFHAYIAHIDTRHKARRNLRKGIAAIRKSSAPLQQSEYCIARLTEHFAH